jgi:hypothetical protein
VPEYKTIILSFDEIIDECNKFDINFYDYDYDFLFSETYNKNCLSCFPSYELLILKYLKKKKS